MTLMRPWDWKDDWTSTTPVHIGYFWMPHNAGEYRTYSGLAYRDLGLGLASSGRMNAHTIIVENASSDWQTHDLDFDFVFVLRGSVTVALDGFDDRVLTRRSTILIPRGVRHRIEALEPDIELVRLTAPAWDVSRKTDELTESTSHPLEPVVTDDRSDAYSRGAGPREYFLYRDLETRDVTDGRIHVHIVQATAPGPGTGWHYHTMAQWFFILDGSAAIQVESMAKQPLQRGDAMCVGRGETMRHNVTGFSEDYTVLEMCVPAEYGTVAVDAPEGIRGE